MKFGIITLGCKVNQYESTAMESILRERGHEAAALGSGLDICILNTCAVTAESVRKSRQTIRRIKKLEPTAFIAICGCYSELNPKEAADLGADLISGTKNRHDFALKAETRTQGDGSPVSYNRHCGLDPQSPTETDTSENTFTETNTREPSPCDRAPPPFELLPPGSTNSRTRALLKIQDGCNNFCTYCIVPYIRGRSRSLPPEIMTKYAKKLQTQGYKEIIITGIEISSYEAQWDGSRLLTAVQTISTAAPGMRLRLGSLTPAVMTEDFCKELSKIPNLCNHFHLSLQSGCDETLKRMGRKYTVAQVMESIKAIRDHFPDCGITADLIAGFPGETENEFAQTLDFIKRAKFSDMHIFPYSLRPGTKAAKMPGHIEKSEKKERARKAAEVAHEMSAEFKKAQIGKETKVLIEQEKKGFVSGHSTNNQEVEIKGKAERNSIKNVRLTAIRNGKLQGEIV